MPRAQGTFEYVLLLGGVLLIVVIAMVTLTGSLPSLDSGSSCAVQARSAVSCFGVDGAFHPERSFTFQEQATSCGCAPSSALAATPSPGTAPAAVPPGGSTAALQTPFEGGLGFDAFQSSITLDGQPVTFRELSQLAFADGTLQNQNTPFGLADVTTTTSTAQGVTRTTKTYDLKEIPNTFIIQHTYESDTAKTLTESKPVSITMDGASGSRLLYGPADGTAYMTDDYQNIPAVDGYTKKGRMRFGGVPVNYAWNAQGGVAVGVISEKPDTFELPLSVQNNQIQMGVRFAPDTTLKQSVTVGPSQPYTTQAVFVSFNNGDYFAPLDRYVGLLERVSGNSIQNQPVTATAKAPYWKTWGLDSTASGSFTDAQLRQTATELKTLGINRILLDYGWFLAEGNWNANPDVFPTNPDAGNAELQALIGELKADGFSIGLWYQPLQVDSTDGDFAAAGLSALSVKNQDGTAFVDDDGLNLLNPAHAQVLQRVKDHFDFFASMGVDHVYVDSQEAQLFSPPDFSQSNPLASHQGLPTLYETMRQKATQHGMVLELCPDGRSHTLLNMPSDVTNIGDPKNDRQLRSEFKSLKALLGSKAVIGTYVDPFDDNGVSGSFLNIVGLGGNLQTMFASPDALGRENWQTFLNLYNEHDLVSGEYLDLYDIGFDYPEGHVVKTTAAQYYAFFTHTEGIDFCVEPECLETNVQNKEAAKPRTFSGTLTLRGLTPNTAYTVTRLPEDTTQTSVSDNQGNIQLAASFDKEALFQARPGTTAPSASPSPFVAPSASPLPSPSPGPSPSPFPSPSPSPVPVPPSFETRSDGAVRVTNPSGLASDQNPAFLDANRILFTRFADGYNQGLATLVLLDVRDGSETVVVNDGGVAVSTSGNPFTPDKSKVCYSSDTQSEDDVWCAPLAGGTPQRITLDESGAHFIEPSVRFDGQRIAFEKHAPGVIDASKGEIWTTDFSGNVLVLLADADDNRLPQYHPSENKVLIQRGQSGLFRLAIVDGQTGAVTDAGIQTDEGTDASFTPSGGIVYSGEGASLVAPEIFLLKNGQSTRITQSAMLDSAPAAAPDESRVAFESRATDASPARIWVIAGVIPPIPAVNPFTIAKGASFSWQLVEPVDTTIAADVYDIDLFNNDASVVQALHGQNRKVICYVSVGSWESFREDAANFPPEAIGNTYEPPFEDEKWLDIRHTGVRDLMKARLDVCKAKGFDAVEPDNIDGYLVNTGFPLTAQDQLDFNRFLAQEAHKRGLSIGLKNDGEQAPELLADFDWALSEECVADNFCEEFQPFSDAGKAVFMVEYTDRSTTLAQLCPVASSRGYFGLLKNRDLDAFRQTC